MKALTEVVVLTWNIAGAEAISANFEFIEREHFLVSLTEIKKLLPLTAPKLNFTAEQTARAQAEFIGLEEVFRACSLDMTRLRRVLRQKLGEGKYSGRRGDIHRSQSSRRIFERARLRARLRQLSALDLLCAIMEDPGELITDALAAQGSSPSKVILAIKQFLEPPAKAEAPRVYAVPQGLAPLLKYGRDLVSLASQNLLSAGVGRTADTGRIQSLLWSDSGRVPVLCGQAGVGKSVLVDTLAANIWEGKVLPNLRGKTIVGMDTAALCALPPEKLRAAQAEIFSASARRDAILYFGHMELLLEAEKKAGLGALRQALLSGSGGLIASMDSAAASALEEQDKELCARIERLDVPEPSPEQALEILKAWKSRLEVVRGARISDRAVDAVMELLGRYRVAGAYPAKAIRMLDRACVLAASAAKNPSGELALRIKELALKFLLAADAEVDEIHAAEAVAEASGRNPEQVLGGLGSVLRSRMNALGRALKDGGLGQTEAAEVVLRQLSSAFSSSCPPQGPLVLAFLGPEGVGKEEMARQIAAGFSGSENDLASFDMSQYIRPEGIQKLFGNQYTKGMLCDLLASRPLSVLMFEHADKTLPMFYQELASFVARRDLKSDSGKAVSLAGLVVIVTSSQFSQVQLDGKKTAGSAEREVLKRFREFLPKQVSGAFTEAVVFKPLNEQMAVRMLVSWIEKARKMVREKCGARLVAGREVERFVLSQGFSRTGGLGHLRMKFDELFLAVVYAAIERRDLLKGADWKMIVARGQLGIVPQAPTSRSVKGTA